jgi:hypothetical protein
VLGGGGCCKKALCAADFSCLMPCIERVARIITKNRVATFALAATRKQPFLPKAQLGAWTLVLRYFANKTYHSPHLKFYIVQADFIQRIHLRLWDTIFDVI